MGLILKRRGYKFTSLLATIVGFVGVGIQFASGYVDPSIAFGIYVLGAFVAGISMCLLNTTVNPMLNTLGGGGNRGNQLIQFGGSCNSIGGTIAPILLGYLIGGSVQTAKVNDAAPAMIIAMAIFALAFLIILLARIPEPHMETADERAARLSGNTKKDPHGPMSFRHFVLGAIAIFFYVGIEVGIPNTANLYMSNLEWVGPVVAGTLVGFYWFLMMCGRLVGGAVGGRVSSKAMLTTVSLLATAFCVLARRELFLMSFDERHARAVGVPVSVANVAFVMMVALVVAVAARTVGSLIVSSMMVVPVACALQLARSWRQVCIFASSIGVLTTVAGLVASYYLGLKPGGTIVLMAVALLVVVLVAKRVTAFVRHTR